MTKLKHKPDGQYFMSIFGKGSLHPLMNKLNLEQKDRAQQFSVMLSL